MKWLLISIISTFSLFAHGFDGATRSTKQAYQVGIIAGTFLPSSVSARVSESIPVVGLVASMPTRLNNFELMFITGKESGIDYMLGSLSMRVDYDAYQVINGFGVIGFTYHHFKPADTATVSYNYQNRPGVQIGFGFTGSAAGNLLLRSDFRLHLGPGKSAYVGMGIVWRFGESGNTSAN